MNTQPIDVAPPAPEDADERYTKRPIPGEPGRFFTVWKDGSYSRWEPLPRSVAP